jgi:hypothetical protein
MNIIDCRTHEKRWRDFCVDKNLQESWLEDLNDLKALNLISICEGHYIQKSPTSSKFSHINLKLKEALLSGFLKDWETLRPDVLNEVHNLFQKGDTYFNFELRFKIRTGRGRLVYQEELVIKMRRYQPRVSEEMDSECHHWFDQSVASIKALDDIILKWHQISNQ